jgi:hypothetical protein
MTLAIEQEDRRRGILNIIVFLIIEFYVASLPNVNILFNSVVSDDAFFGTLDLTDFYLGTPLTPSSLVSVPLFTER